jgi:hypothetical protein
MDLSQVPATLQALGVAGVLFVGIYWLMKAWVVPKPLHDEIVKIYREGAEAALAANRELSQNMTKMVDSVEKLTASMEQLVRVQQETLATVRADRKPT